MAKKLEQKPRGHPHHRQGEPVSPWGALRGRGEGPLKVPLAHALEWVRRRKGLSAWAPAR